MIKTTFETILKAAPVLDKLSKQSLQIKTSYGIAKAIAITNSEIEIFHKQRIALCEKYGKANPDTNLYDIINKDDFNKDYNMLLSLDIELDFKPIELTTDICISAQDILAIEAFIEPIEGVET